MSKTIDERVVEMRFDNSRFERNVQQSMSTLDKLKQSLNLNGAAKGLDSINAASKKFDLSGMENGVGTLHAKFSALEVVGVTALANIANSAVNTGKKIISALSIEPITTGFNEYETKINSIQTIMSNTASKGETMESVTKVIDELNTYADKTIYNFSEMTRNIGTFTAAGVGLKESAAAIQGIANLAAASGSNSQQASTAMYQLSQALAAGTVKLQDWNSVVNAGMGGEKFQEALKQTAREHGVAIDKIIKDEGSFRESLQKGWMTADILNETLNKFTVKGAKEYAAAMVKSGKYTEAQAKALVKEAQAMEDAATKVKTFTQLWDTLKEAAQSGWGKTWELIVGDFEEAKSLFTDLSIFLGGIIDKSSDRRNKLLEGALGDSKWNEFNKQIKKAGISTKDFEKQLKKTAKSNGIAIDDIIKKEGSLANAFKSGKLSTSLIVDTLKSFADGAKTTGKSTEDMTGKLKKFQKVVNDVWIGDYKNGEERVKALTKAGYDYNKVQDLVNKTVNGHKLTLEDLSDAQLKNVGYTDKQVKKIRELAEEAEKSGTPLNELINDLNKPTGRELLIDSFKNILGSLVTVISSVRKAWRNIFPRMTSSQLYDIIEAFNSFSEKLVISDGNAKKLKRTFKGLFALVSIVSDIIGGGFKLAFNAVTSILDYFNLDILDVTARLGDALVAFREATDVTKVFSVVIKAVASGTRKLVEVIGELPIVQKIMDKIRESLSDLKNMDWSEVGTNIIEGLKNGLGDGGKQVVDKIIELGKSILEGIKGILGIHSPSTEFFEIGKNIIQGLINGVISGAEKVFSTIQNLASGIIDIISRIDFGAVFSLAITGGIFYTVKRLTDVLEMFGSPLEGLGDIFENVSKVLNGFAKNLQAAAFEKKTQGIYNLAKSIAVLAASVYVLSKIETGALIQACAAIVVLGLVIGGLALACSKMSSEGASIGKNGVKLKGLNTGLLAIAASLFVLAKVVKIVGTMNPDQAKQGFAGLTGMIVLLGGFVVAYGKFVNDKAVENMNKAGKMLLKMSISIGILALVAKLIGGMSWDELGIAAAGLTGAIVLLGGFFVAYGKFINGKAAQNMDKAGKMMLKMSLSLLLIIGVMKLAGTLSEPEIDNGIACMIAFSGFVLALTAITKLGGKNIDKVGKMMMSLSISLLLMIGVIKLVSGMETDELIKGGAVILAFVGVVALMVKVLKGVERDVPRIASTLIAMSLAIGILAMIAIILSLVSIPGLIKGVTAVSILSLFMSMMIKATRGANDCKGNLIAMTVAIGIMAAAVVALSMVKPEKLAGATAAMSIMMLMFAKIAKASSSLNGSMGALIAMTVAIGVLGGVIYLLSTLPMDKVLNTCASLSVVMISLGASMKLIGSAGSGATAAIPALGAMIIAVGLITAIFWAIDALNIETSMETALALSTLLLSMAGVCFILSKLGGTATGAIAGAAAFDAVIVIIGGLMVGLGALFEKFEKIIDLEGMLDKGIAILGKIGTGIGTFVGNIIGGFTAGATSGLPEVGTNLSKFMMNLQPFIVGCKMIDETVINSMTSLVKMMGMLAGNNIKDWFASKITGDDSMEKFGIQLSQFADAIVKFSKKISGNIDESSVTAAANAGLMLSKMQNNIQGVGGVFQFFTGEKDLAQFGVQIQAFGRAIVNFSKTVADNIDEKAVKAAANAGVIMAKMQEKVAPSGGVVQWFTGEKDMALFGSQLVSFGYAIVNFSKSVSGEGAIDEKAVKAAAHAGNIMSKMQEKIVPTGGVVQWFTGEKDMALFGSQLVSFGYAIVNFSKTVADNIDEKAISAAANAGTLMTEMQSKIVPSGGVIELFTGSQDMADFGAQIVAFGEAIVTFSEKVSGNINSAAVLAAGNAGLIMAKLQEAIPEDHWFDGKVSLDEFGEDIADFGEYLADYGDAISSVEVTKITASLTAAERLVTLARTLTGIDTSGIENFKMADIGKEMKNYYDKIIDIEPSKVSSSITSAGSLVTLCRNLIGLDTSGIKDFKVSGIGKEMKTYSDKVAGIDSIKIIASVASAGRLVTLIKSLSGIDTGGVSKFTKAVNELGKMNLSGLSKAFSGASSKMLFSGSKITESLAKGMGSKTSALTKVASAMVTSVAKKIESQTKNFLTLGIELMGKFISGIINESSTLNKSFATVLTSAISTCRGYYTNFYDAGSYVVSGFANGISSKTWQAEAKTTEMAKAAVKAARKELKINSPSKVFMKIGGGVPEGFAKGINKFGYYVTDSIGQMSKNSLDQTKNVISNIASVLDTDIDTQPTIRPVVDLSDVEASSGRINGLFGQSISLGVSANSAGVVSAMMSNNSQNGNEDVVSAIDKLRKELGNVGGTTYKIDGITYDDGSNITNAVKSLVRAAKIERRI